MGPSGSGRRPASDERRAASRENCDESTPPLQRVQRAPFAGSWAAKGCREAPLLFRRQTALQIDPSPAAPGLGLKSLSLAPARRPFMGPIRAHQTRVWQTGSGLSSKTNCLSSLALAGEPKQCPGGRSSKHTGRKLRLVEQQAGSEQWLAAPAMRQAERVADRFGRAPLYWARRSGRADHSSSLSALMRGLLLTDGVAYGWRWGVSLDRGELLFG